MTACNCSRSDFPDDVKRQRSDLLIRDFFPRLLQRIETMGDSLLTGVAGTGKSWWVWIYRSIPRSSN